MILPLNILLGFGIPAAVVCLHLAGKASRQTVPRLADAFSLPAEVRRLASQTPPAIATVAVASALCLVAAGVPWPWVASSAFSTLCAALVARSGR